MEDAQATQSILSVPMHPTFSLDLDTSPQKINGAHPFIVVNMSAKFDEDSHKGLVFIVFKG